MSEWEKLAEARIREWLQRPPEDRPPGLGEGPLVPLETQLLDEALELTREANGMAEGPERRDVERRRAAVETRLLILLERSGRPLAAQRISELLSQARTRFGANGP